MAVVVDAEKCNGCKSCVDSCPSEGLAVPDSVAVVNPDNCIDCGACIDACPSGAITAG